MTESRHGGPLPANVRKIILLLLRYVLPVAALAYLVRTLSGMPRGIFDLWISSLDIQLGTFLLLALLLVLAAVNWMLEAVKWKLLAGKLEPISIGKAFRGILYGVCLGFVTPKRSGEIAGRALVLKPGNQVKGMLINMAGGLSQLGVTLVVGLASLGWVIYFRGTAASHDASIPSGLAAASDIVAASSEPATASGPSLAIFPLAILLALIFLLLYSHRLLRWYLSTPGIPKWTTRVSVLLQVSRPELGRLVGLSFIRYLVFLLQFFLLLQVFQTPISLYASFLLLSITYLVLAAIPLSALGEAGIRGSVVLLAYGWIAAGVPVPPLVETGLVAGILGLWLVNLVLPALAGAALALGGGVSLNARRALA
jgi:hypothetical protein